MREDRDEETLNQSDEDLPQIEMEDFETEASSDSKESVSPTSYSSFQYSAPVSDTDTVTAYSRPRFKLWISGIALLCGAVFLGYYSYLPQYSYQQAMEKLDTEDHHKAILLLHQSANRGYRQAQEALGQIYYYGEGTERDLQAALDWFQKASEQDSPLAQFALGTMYCKGEGINPDKEQCRKLLEEAAEAGHVEAAKTLNRWFLK